MITVDKSLITVSSLDCLYLGSENNGSTGTNRCDMKHKMIDADNDIDAIKTWLAEFHDSPQTFRSYRKEAERLLLWALIERNKPLSSLSRTDMLCYESFLAAPTPAEQWCGPRKQRTSSDWKPFQGPLKPASQHQALIICQALFSYLVEAGYLGGNPLSLRRRRRSKAKTAQQHGSQERFLEQELWDFLVAFIDKMPQETHSQQTHFERVRYLFSLLYLLGPRVSEVASHTMGSFRELRGSWWWQVTGKGNKHDKVPVNSAMLEALGRYRVFYGLDPHPDPEDTTPLMMSVKGTSGISANMVYRLVKQTVSSAADELEKLDVIKAEKLRKSSTHWFRHTAITHQADAGIELRYLNKSARHTKLETTSIYLHAEDDAWHDAMEKHTIKK